MKPDRSRIILYLAGIVAGFVLPVAAAFLLGFLGPSPYLLDESGLGDEWSSPRQFPDGSTVSVTTWPTPAEAQHQAESISRSIPASSTSQTLNTVRYTRADDGRRGLLLPVGRGVVQIEAADDGAIDQRLGSLPFVRANPEQNLLWTLFTRHAGVAMLGLALYILGLGLVMARGASWAAEIAPLSEAAPVSEKTLRARILALNGRDLPFQVREEPNGRLAAEWRIADARWVGLMEAGGLREVHTVYIDLDAGAHRARSLDVQRNVWWSSGTAHVSRPSSYFRGITFFDHRRGTMVGAFFRDGRWTTKAYDYRFVLSEMKAPLVEAIVGSGWRFSPVLSLSRSLGWLLG
jgi:hypothetical protein